MIDQKLLEAIEQGKLHVDHQTLDVHVYHGSHRRFVLKKPDQHPVSGRYRFRFGSARHTVYRNKLVWMYFNRRVVPDGYFVDHRDVDCCNDHPSNLRLMSKKESQQQGQELQQDNALFGWRCFFEYIEFTGQVPPDDSVLWT